jgi:hypothetical protein
MKRARISKGGKEVVLGVSSGLRACIGQAGQARLAYFWRRKERQASLDLTDLTFFGAMVSRP